MATQKKHNIGMLGLNKQHKVGPNQNLVQATCKL